MEIHQRLLSTVLVPIIRLLLSVTFTGQSNINRQIDIIARFIIISSVGLVL